VNIAGLRDYPENAVAAARDSGTALIDLNAMSIDVVKGLGPKLAPRAYVEGLHTNSYGGYILSRCIVEGIRQNNFDIARHIVADAGAFDPAHPQPLPDDFKLPLEPGGNRGGRGGRGGAGRGPATAPGAAQSAPPAAQPPGGREN
jgi:hypothetical protein